MISTATSEPKLNPSDNEKGALVKLLCDDDPAVYQQIRDKILSYGPPASEWLHPYELSGDPVVRRRSKEIISFFSRQTADNDFLGFCLNQGEDLDLEEGIWQLARTRFPEINIAGYGAILDSIAGDLCAQIDYGSPPDQILATVNHALYLERGFAGNEQDYYDPDNSYFNRVLDRRTGNPISLCLLYFFIGRRLKLPIVGIGMPGHFLVRFQSSAGDIFVDAFNRGKLLTKADCVRFLLHTSYGFQESFLTPITSRRALLRVCSNLHQIYTQRGSAADLARFQRYIVALAK